MPDQIPAYLLNAPASALIKTGTFADMHKLSENLTKAPASDGREV